MVTSKGTMTIALDPAGAPPYLDNPGYRYQRIAYPLAARAVVLGRQQLVPEGLLAVNLVAIAGGTLALAAWLRRRRLSPWIAAVWGLHPGQVVSLQRDLADAAGYAVVAVGLWLRDRSAIAASLTFGLAGLTRETTLIFPVLLAGADLLGRRRRRSRCLLELAIAVLPFAAWKLFLTGWLARSGHAGGSFNPLTEIFSPVPFAGIAYWLPRDPGALPVLSAVIVPALICLAAAAWAAWRRLWSAETALLAANVLPVVFAASAVWAWAPSGPRQALGAVLAAILTLTGLPARGWFWLAAGFWLWLAPVWLLRPL
jgi:hypothetical protein